MADRGPGRGPGRVPAVLGLDLGTSEAKAALVSLDGQLLGLGRGTYPTDTGPDGRAEQDPGQWWAALSAAVRSLAPAIADAELLAVCCVGQGPTLTVVDAAGEPVRPAVTWQDRRAGAGGYGLLPRMAWLAREDPARAAQARWQLASWDAVGLWLSGVAATTVQDHEMLPSGEALAAAGVRAVSVPEALPFGSRLGSLRAEAASRLGLPTGLPNRGFNATTAASRATSNNSSARRERFSSVSSSAAAPEYSRHNICTIF